MSNEEILQKTKTEKKKRFFTPWHIAPLIVMVLLIVAALLYTSGRSVELSKYKFSLLPNEANEYVDSYDSFNEKADVVLIYDSDLKDSSVHYKESLEKVLDDIRVDHRVIDLGQKVELPKKGDLVLFCTIDFDKFNNAQFDGFVDWLQEGNIIFFCEPDFYSSFAAIKDYIGISSISDMSVEIDDIQFLDDILPGLKGETLYDSGLVDSVQICNLKEESHISVLESKKHAPIIWDYSNGKNNVTVYNNTLLDEKNVIGGIAANSVVKHLKQHAWPIINSKMVFIDDFPAPQPEGFDERLKEQFGYDTQAFFMNIWWPDMKKLADKHGIKYNGVFVETYNTLTSPPFPRGYASTIIRYYGAEVLSTGGEIALHGYNHQSLIPEGYPNDDDYLGWPNKENMVIATKTLNDYATSIFPEVTYTSYVPPSNYLSYEGLQALREAVPSMKVISALYYQNLEDTAYCTDFYEEENGIINVPRITSGYDMGPFDELLMYNAAYSEGVVSHFIHPDDVLDVDRGAEAGWNAMRDALDASYDRLDKTYPMLRGLTATPTAGLVQRRQRCFIKEQNIKEGKKDKVKLTLSNFVDEQWVAFYTEKEIDTVENGEFYDLGGGSYWIDCHKDNIIITLK